MNQGYKLVADGLEESYVERRHRTLIELKRTIQRHPAVDITRSNRQDDGRFRELDIVLSSLILGIDVDSAGLRIAWRPRLDPDEPAYFVFHYHDSSGLDFGWYREPNPHVDGLAHYQERSSSDDEYEYEPADFDSLVPVALCWDIPGRIEERLGV